MSWWTGFTKFKEELEIANKVIAHAKTLGIDIGTPVKYNGTVYKIKQIWINTANEIQVRVELDHPHLEDYMIDIDDIEYGPAIAVLFGEDNVPAKS